MSAATLIGSSWDLGTSPDGLLPRHLAEWVDGSAVAPELAAANLLSLAGTEVLEALVGDRLAQMGGWAQQFTTAGVARLLRPLEAVAEGGGWWCAGLDPTANWAPMSWGCFKPDRPRWDQERNRQRKYEHPLKVAARVIVLRVPATVAAAIAAAHDLQLPAEVAADTTGAAGAFWRWWAREPRLPLVITEGAKKAAALLSAGLPAVALPGIWNGATKDSLGRRALHPDLAALPLEGRACRVLFDWSSSETGRRDVARACRRQGYLLKRAGADAVLIGSCPGPHKGADDHLAAGGTWAELLAALEPLAPLPVLPQLRRADVTVPAGTYLGKATKIPMHQRLVALAAAMGAGKTELIAGYLAPLMAAGTRVVLITHRTSLGAALAERLGLPWAEEAAPGSDLRQMGIALCIDSLCPGSGLRINPADWKGAVVVIDECCAVLAHALFGIGTAVAQRRPAVLQTLQQLLAHAGQILVADAQLNEPVLQALEAAAGTTARLIASNHQPAAGRQLTVLPDRDSWRGTFAQLLQQRKRLWVATTAKEKANGAQALALAALEHWPDARVLVVNSDTVADPAHDAYRLAADPNGIAALYDLIIATPALAAGVSVELRGHFDAVLVAAGGTTDANAVAQAAARVRDHCPRYLFAPEKSPGNALRVGCGSHDPDTVLRNMGDHAALVGQLLLAGGWSIGAPCSGPWLAAWAQLAAEQNAIRHSYLATVVGLLQREGYRVIRPAEGSTEALEAEGLRMAEQLQAIATEEQTAADLAVQQAELLSDREALELQRKRRRSPAERAALQRWRIARTWALGAAAPTAELLEAERNGLGDRLQFRWMLTTAEGRQAAARHDMNSAQAIAAGGAHWQPDLLRQQHGPRLQVAEALGLAGWLQRAEWFTADDHQLVELHDRMVRCGLATVQALGISAATAGGSSTAAPKLRTTTLKRLLALVGYRLEAKRNTIDGVRCWRYRVVPEALPAEVSWEAITSSWARSAAQHSPYRERGALGQGHQQEVAA